MHMLSTIEIRITYPRGLWIYVLSVWYKMKTNQKIILGKKTDWLHTHAPLTVTLERHICQYRQYNWQKIRTPNIKEYTSWKNVAKSK